MRDAYLATSLEEHVHLDSPSKNTINARLKKGKLDECLVVSSHVPTLKREAKHRYIVCFMKQLKELLLVHISVFNFMLHDVIF